LFFNKISSKKQASIQNFFFKPAGTFNVITKKPISPNYISNTKKTKQHFASPFSSLTHISYDFGLFCYKILSQNKINDILHKV